MGSPDVWKLPGRVWGLCVSDLSGFAVLSS